MFPSNEHPASIKRQRTTISCSVCRKRKSKCDRQRPVCGSCKKKSLAHLCSYEEVPKPPQNHYFTVIPSPGPFSDVPQPPLSNTGPNLLPQTGGVPPMSGAPENAANFSFPSSQMPSYFPSKGHIPLPGTLWTPVPGPYFNNARISQQGTQHPSPSLNQVGTYSQPQLSNQFDFSGTGISKLESKETDSSHELPVKPGTTYVFPPYNPRESPGIETLHHKSSVRSDSISSVPISLPHHPSVSPEESNSSFSSKNRRDSLVAPREVSDSSKEPTIPILTHGKATENVTSGQAGFQIQNHVADSDPKLTSQSSSFNHIQSREEGISFSPDRSDYSFQSPTKPFFPQGTDSSTSKFATVSIGSNILRIAVDDRMDAFSYASSTLLVEGTHWQQQGPLSYVGLTKKDQFFRLVRNFTVRLFRSEQFSQFVSKNQQNSVRPNSESGIQLSNGGRFPGYSEEPESEQDILNEDTLITSKIHHGREKNVDSDGYNMNYPTILPGLQSLNKMHHSKQIYYRFVEEKVHSILPNKANISDAINKYFQYVHPFVPIFHEQSFLKEIDGSFQEPQSNSEEMENHHSILIRNDSLLNLTGQLLLIVRLGYMTLIPNNDSHRKYTSTERALIKEITRSKASEYLSVVNLCIPEEKVQAKSSFKLVQSLVLLFFYRSVAPNDCLGLSGSESQLLHGAIVNHALSIGLNRDPLKYDTINSVPKDPIFVLQWRSLWSYIVNLDALNSIYCGMPLKLPDLDTSDTEKPLYENTSENVSNFTKAVDSVCSCYRRIVRKITNLKSKVKVVDLLTETSKLEKIFLDIFGKDFFKDYICVSAPEDINRLEPDGRQRNEEAYLKVHRFLLFINTRANLSCLYYLVVIHYEQRLDSNPGAESQAGIELFKIFIRSVVQLVYIMSYVLDNIQELFGKSYDYILTSRIERSMIKTHTFASAFFIRLVNYKRTLAMKEMTGKALASNNEENFEERCDIVDSLFTIILLEAELFVGNFRTLSKTYINSYKLYVMAFFVLKQCMEDPGILLAGVTNNKESFFNDGTNLIQFLSNAELESLCKLCEEFRLAKLESVRRQKEHQNGHRGKEIKKPRHEKKTGNYVAPKYEPGSGEVIDSNPNENTVSSDLEDDHSSQSSGIFDATIANRAMYANEDTVNTYGSLTQKHMHQDYQGEVFDEQNMIGNDELLQLFDTYGLLDG